MLRLSASSLVPREIPMRILALSILALGAISAAEPAKAQTYDPSYPVCLHVNGPVSYYECRYTSMAQCAMSASGRSAQCLPNPYIAQAYAEPSVRHAKRHHVY
jgi:Protein of unknown function (DUF3551)